MNVSLTPHLEKLVQEKVASGLYNSASEVIREALRLLEEKDRLRQIRMEELKRQVTEGVDALDRGEFIELDESGLNDYMQDVNKRGRERLAKKKKKPATK